MKRNFTEAAADWKIALSKKCGSKDDAIYPEKFIKRMKNRKFIHNPKYARITYLKDYFIDLVTACTGCRKYKAFSNCILS